MNQMQFNNIYYDFIIKYLSRDKFNEKLIIEICEYMLKGNLVIRYSHVPKSFTFENRLKFTPKTIDWDIEYDNISGLCQLYLHSLESVKYLIQGYEISNDIRFVELANEIINSWLHYSKMNTSNKFTWYDHCVSERVVYLIYFTELIKKRNLQGYEKSLNSIEKAINEHGDFLYEDKNYTTQNHGTMMDRSLYLLSRYTLDERSEKWREKALNRLRKSIQSDFSQNMVNLENSSSYQLFNFDMFVVIEKELLNLFGDSLGENFQSVIDKGIEYMVYLSKPDLNFPVMGDGSKFSIASIKKHPSFKYVNTHDNLKYVLTNGEEGSAPTELFKVYPEEGYAFIRNSWDYKNKKDQITYTSFIAGYKLKNHKHGDDLSFTLFSKGKDIFVDCGTFTYQAGEFRSHFMSALSHNTIIVDGTSYPFIHGDPNETGILNYGDENHYSYVIAKNDLYPGVNITRSFHYLTSGNIVIIDDIYSKRQHTYSQLFHLSHRLNVDHIKIIGNSYVEIIEEDIKISVGQVQKTDLFIHRGNRKEAGLGLISEGFNVMEETTALEYQIKGKNARFITTITVNAKEEESNIKATIVNNKLIVKDGDSVFEINLKSYNRSVEEGVCLEEEKINQNSYKFTVTGAKEGVEYAWYVFKNGERIDIIWYTDNPELEYTFNETGTYEIQYFIRDKVKIEDKVRYIYENKIKI
jgi:hypothetical protein